MENQGETCFHSCIGIVYCVGKTLYGVYFVGPIDQGFFQNHLGIKKKVKGLVRLNGLTPQSNCLM